MNCLWSISSLNDFDNWSSSSGKEGGVIWKLEEPDAESVSDLSVSVQILLKETLKVDYTPTQSL